MDKGDININTANHSYRIANNEVLWHKGNDNNIFVGVGSGFNNGTGNFNVSIGKNAHYNNVDGKRNFIGGFEAGFNNSVSNDEVMVGYRAGYSLNGLTDGNVFVGSRAGYSETIGGEHVMIGFKAGELTNQACCNTFVGNVSGAFNTTGINNSFFGAGTGNNNTTGSGITLLGSTANVGKPNLVNATAVGFRSRVMNDNQMVLGDSFTYVGIGLSHDLLGPQNWLEIDARINGAAPVTPGTIGSSGLRFRDLNSNCLTIPNPGAGLLSVDANGDVIYVPAGTNVNSPGNYCTNPGAPNAQSNHFEIRQNNFNYFFEGNGYRNNAVLMGYGCGNTPRGRLSVLENDLNVSNIVNDSYNGVYAAIRNQSAGQIQEFTALYADANYLDPNFAINRPIHTAGKFTARGAEKNYGIYSMATGNITSFGGYFEASGGVTNYAVFARSLPGGSANGPNYAGYFDGDVHITGFLNLLSDVNYKQQIDSIANPVELIEQLKPIKYQFNTTQYPHIGLPSGVQYGFSAQDVAQIMPELVSTVTRPELRDSSGNVIEPQSNYLSLKMEQLIPVSIAAIKKQNEIIKKQDSLIQSIQNQLAQLSTVINTCCNYSNTKASNQNASVIDIDLSDKDIVVLNQNVPNPFAEQTTITYNIPQNSGFAQIIFYNHLGQLIKVVDIKTKGKGQLNVFANDLTNGIYSYSLIIDGKIHDTKKMAKQN